MFKIGVKTRRILRFLSVHETDRNADLLKCTVIFYLLTCNTCSKCEFGFKLFGEVCRDSALPFCGLRKEAIGAFENTMLTLRVPRKTGHFLTI